jgi:hypothetical protein
MIDRGIDEVLASLVVVAAAIDMLAVAEAMDGIDDSTSSMDCKGAMPLVI